MPFIFENIEMLHNDKMKKLIGKIVLVDKEKYEKALIEVALHEKRWNAQIEYFSNAKDALDYLIKTDQETFIIISEVNMPSMNGLDFKKAIDNNPILNKKSIPFIFASTAATREQVAEAYEYRVQGYFKKPITLKEQADVLDTIIRYWIISRHPNKVDF